MGTLPCRAKFVDDAEHQECCIQSEIRFCNNAPCSQRYFHHTAEKPLRLHEMLLCDGRWIRPQTEAYSPTLNWSEFGFSDEEQDECFNKLSGFQDQCFSATGPRIEDSDAQWRRHLFKRDLKLFAHAAVSGTECTLIREDGYNVGRLQLDRWFKKMTIVAETEVEETVLAIYRFDLELKDIKDIYRFEMARQLYPGITGDLPIPQEDWTRVLAVVHMSNGKQVALCLLEADHEARERMLACWKFLQRRAVKDDTATAQSPRMASSREGQELTPNKEYNPRDSEAASPVSTLGGRRLSPRLSPRMSWS